MHIYPQQSWKPRKTLLGIWTRHVKTRNNSNFLMCIFFNEASVKEIMGSMWQTATLIYKFIPTTEVILLLRQKKWSFPACNIHFFAVSRGSVRQYSQIYSTFCQFLQWLIFVFYTVQFHGSNTISTDHKHTGNAKYKVLTAVVINLVSWDAVFCRHVTNISDKRSASVFRVKQHNE